MNPTPSFNERAYWLARAESYDLLAKFALHANDLDQANKDRHEANKARENAARCTVETIENRDPQPVGAR